MRVLTAKNLRGLVISELGEVYGTKMRVSCPDCRHQGVACYNFLTDLAIWVCGRCGQFANFKNLLSEEAPDGAT